MGILLIAIFVIYYEIFNKPEGFGSTTFLQNLNQQRALEGEIARIKAHRTAATSQKAAAEALFRKG